MEEGLYSSGDSSCSDNPYEDHPMLLLTGVHSNVRDDEASLVQCLSRALDILPTRVMVIDDPYFVDEQHNHKNDVVHFLVSPDRHEKEDRETIERTVDHMAHQMNAWILQHRLPLIQTTSEQDSRWLRVEEAECTVYKVDYGGHIWIESEEEKEEHGWGHDSSHEDSNFSQEEEDYPPIFELTGVRIRHQPSMAKHISRVLDILPTRVMVVDVILPKNNNHTNTSTNNTKENDHETANHDGDAKINFIVLPNDDDNEEEDCDTEPTANQMAHRMNVWIHHHRMPQTTTTTITNKDQDKYGWLRVEEAQCTVVTEMEEEVWIESEEEALELWRDMSEDARTCHLAAVPSPDGVLVLPSHNDPTIIATTTTTTTHDDVPTNNDDTSASEEFVSPTWAQLKRDPSLLELDNVRRVHASELHTVSSWDEPIVIVGMMVIGSWRSHNTTINDEEDFLSRERLVERFGDVEVRTGNRNTLVENGFVNSKPMTLRDAIRLDNNTTTTTTVPSHRSDLECSRIVFSPVQELPDTFRETLESLMTHSHSLSIPPLLGHQTLQDGDDSTSSSSLLPPLLLASNNEDKKYTLCLGSEGFGIGFHRHGAALFSLVVGRKKWYMGPPDLLDHDEKDANNTHPAFYTTKSTHKCLQQPGEVLYVPDQWYHEIFNLEYTAGIQTLSSI